jgi:hypothetical protein
MHPRIRLLAHGTAPLLTMRTLELANDVPLQLPFNLEDALPNFRLGTYRRLPRHFPEFRLRHEKRTRDDQLPWTVLSDGFCFSNCDQDLSWAGCAP